MGVAALVLAGSLAFAFAAGYLIGVDLRRQETAERRRLEERRRAEPPWRDAD